jgi:hypothetical protein
MMLPTVAQRRAKLMKQQNLFEFVPNFGHLVVGMSAVSPDTSSRKLRGPVRPLVGILASDCAAQAFSSPRDFSGLTSAVENDSMRIELLHIDECPNAAKAQERLEAALTALGHRDFPVNTRLLGSASDTAGTGFAGSPTITVNGSDIFPTGAPASDLACRIYATPSGLAGLPTINQIAAALKNNGL